MGLFLGARLGTQPRRGGRGGGEAIPDEQLALPMGVPEPSEETEAAEYSPPVVELGTNREKLRRIFDYAAEQLRLIQTRLKAKGKVDYATRLVYLFLYAHAEEGRTRVRRTDLNEMLISAGLYDGNIRKWIANSPDLMRDGEGLELNIPGREQARRILDEVLDPDRPDGWTIGSSPQMRRTKSGSKRDETTDGSPKGGRRKGSSTAGRSTPVKEWVAAWKSRKRQIDGHSLLRDRSLADKGIFALWAIRDTMGESAKLVSPCRLSNFLYEAFEIKADDRALGRALAAEASSSKRVLKIDDQGVKYQINPSGIKYAEEMAGVHVVGESVARPTNGQGD